MGRAELTRAAEIFNAGLTEMRGAASPRLLLELMCAAHSPPGGGRRRSGHARPPGAAWSATAFRRGASTDRASCAAYPARSPADRCSAQPGDVASAGQPGAYQATPRSLRLTKATPPQPGSCKASPLGPQQGHDLPARGSPRSRLTAGSSAGSTPRRPVTSPRSRRAAGDSARPVCCSAGAGLPRRRAAQRVQAARSDARRRMVRAPARPAPRPGARSAQSVLSRLRRVGPQAADDWPGDREARLGSASPPPAAARHRRCSPG